MVQYCFIDIVRSFSRCESFPHLNLVIPDAFTLCVSSCPRISVSEKLFPVINSSTQTSPQNPSGRLVLQMLAQGKPGSGTESELHLISQTEL